MSEPSQRPPVASSPLSVILFAQALSTETTESLQAWHVYLQSLRRPYEIFLIQETRSEVSTDVTAEPAETRIFPYERADGYRAVLNEAIRATQHPLLVFCTCDKQYQPSDLEHLLKTIDKVDLVAAYRAGGQAPPWRVILDLFVGIFCRVILGIPMGQRVCWFGSAGRGRRWIARWIFGVRVLDPECPFRLVRRGVFEHLPIQSSGPFAPVEILAKANHLTCLLAEEPVTWMPPALPTSDAHTFGQDAWITFREPDFGRREVEPTLPCGSRLTENAGNP